MQKLGNNTKTAKAPDGIKNFIMHLSPAKKVRQLAEQPQAQELLLKRLGRRPSTEEINSLARANTCPWAGACEEYCLDTSGHGQRNTVQNARIAKTAHLYIDKETFTLELQKEIAGKFKYHERKGNKLAIRLNGTSDLDFLETIALFPGVQFYDYSKDPNRFKAFLKGELPSNYHLTFSYDRDQQRKSFADYHGMIFQFMEQGGNIAIIQKDYDNVLKQCPSCSLEPTIDGDKHDVRFLDGNQGAFVILQPKGKAKK